MPEQYDVSEFARRVVAAKEKERPRPSWEQEVMGIRPDLFPELDGRVSVEHNYKKPVDPGPYVPDRVIVGGLPAKKLRHDIGVAPDGSRIPDDPFPQVSLPGTEWGRSIGKRIGDKLGPKVPDGLRQLGSEAIAGYVNWADSLRPDYTNPGHMAIRHEAEALDETLTQEKTLKAFGDKVEQKAREWSPQYKYDRTLQEYIRAMQKAGAVQPIDGGELD